MFTQLFSYYDLNPAHQGGMYLYWKKKKSKQGKFAIYIGMNTDIQSIQYKRKKVTKNYINDNTNDNKMKNLTVPVDKSIQGRIGWCVRG